jgi:hypothetical protein
VPLGRIADDDHAVWYRELFGPSVTAGIVQAADLAGYRNGQVYIRRSMHTPPNVEAVRDLMPAFFELLLLEEQPAVRVVLGHFFFVYIHPNGWQRAKDLMNPMMASPWTIVPLNAIYVRRRAWRDKAPAVSAELQVVARKQTNQSRTLALIAPTERTPLRPALKAPVGRC